MDKQKRTSNFDIFNILGKNRVISSNGELARKICFCSNLWTEAVKNFLKSGQTWSNDGQRMRMYFI